MTDRPQGLAGVRAFLGREEYIRHVADAGWLSRWPSRGRAADAVLVATDTRLVSMRLRLVWDPGDDAGLEVVSACSYAAMSRVRRDGGARGLCFTCEGREWCFLPAAGLTPAGGHGGPEWEALVAFVMSRVAERGWPAEELDATRTGRSDPGTPGDLAAICAAHGLHVAVDDGGDRLRLAVDGQTVFVHRLAEAPFVSLSASLPFRAAATRAEALELCNRLNGGAVMVRCSVGGEEGALALQADYHVRVEGVPEGEALAGLPAVFVSLLRAAIARLDRDRLVVTSG